MVVGGEINFAVEGREVADRQPDAWDNRAQIMDKTCPQKRVATLPKRHVLHPMSIRRGDHEKGRPIHLRQIADAAADWLDEVGTKSGPVGLPQARLRTA